MRLPRIATLPFQLLRVGLAWAVVMGLLLFTLVQSRQVVELEAAQRARASAQTAAARMDSLFTQTRIWSQELQRLITADELMAEAPAPPSRVRELDIWVTDLQRLNPVIANLGYLDAHARSYRQRGRDPHGALIDFSGQDYWLTLERLGAAGADQLVVSRVHRLQTTGKQGIVQARGVYTPGGQLAGAVLLGLHLETLEQELRGLNPGGAGAVALLDGGNRLIARDPAMRTAEPLLLRRPREPGPIEGSFFVVSSIDGKRRLSALVALKEAPFQVGVGLAEEDYLASWYSHRLDIWLAMAALSLAALVLGVQLLRNARASERLASAEGALGLALGLLPGACVLATGQPLRLTRGNAAARSLLALPEDSQPHLSSVFADAEALDTLLAEARRLGSTAPRDLGLRRGEEVFRATVQAARQPGRRAQEEQLLFTLIDVEARHLREEELQRQSSIDLLTGLANRRSFLAEAQKWMTHCRRHGEPLALLMIDLDHFKAINDRFGHPGGDAVLRAVAERLQAQMRSPDLVARLGGEEFACLLPKATPEAAERVASRLLEALRHPPIPVGGEAMLQVTASIGVTGWLPDEDDIEWALARADVALYRAKDGGRDRYELER